MLVCAVLQTSDVRHVGDAMVVGDASLVVPLFEATSASWTEPRSRPALRQPVTQLAQVAPSATTSAPKSVARVGSKGGAKAKGNSKNTQQQPKASKFMARL